MGKKSKRNRSKASSEAKRAAPAARQEEVETKDNLRFQDPFVEEVVPDNDAGECQPSEDDDNNNNNADVEIIQSWDPLRQTLEPGQALEMDPAAYKMYHALTPEWPSLSFDFLRDDLGESRTRFPHTLTAAVGTQAQKADQNQLTILKLSDLSKIKVETEDDLLGEEFNPEEDESDDDSEAEIDLDPILEHYAVPHYGGVNRVRCMPQQSNIVATWSDVGQVNVFNVETITQRFAAAQGKAVSQQHIPTKPFFRFSKHTTEGYAMDWSPVRKGILATGDCHGSIHVWNPRPDGSFAVSAHTSSDGADAQQSLSVEDIQWSPSEETVFMSAECGGHVCIFDTRAPQRSMLRHCVHPHTDVNVVSWNKLVHNLVATGGDDGVLCVWDLRHFSATDSNKKLEPLARFTPHQTPITSVEWHPTDESMLAVSDSAGTYIYDLSVEQDDAAPKADGVPPQLLFVHCGSEQFKEVHWHPQISSCLMTTALTGFSVFIPSNL